MSKKVLIKTLQVIQLIIIVTLVLVVQNNSNQLEKKIENINVNKSLDLASMTAIDWDAKLSEQYISFEEKIGSLTGYAADCPLCSGLLGCSPYLDVRDRTTTFNDETYGTVKIVAASASNLKCGSIISFKSERISNEVTYAIVLDRGVSGNAIDLLMPSQYEATQVIGRSNITYSVLRNGWEK